MKNTSVPASEFKPEEFPEAHVVRNNAGWGWASAFLWLPALALVAAITSFVIVSGEEGRTVEVRFEQGYGLRVGDPVKHRGIEVGHVTAIGLSHELDGVVAKIEFLQAADELAREGTRFWIERPQLGLGKMSGLDTVVGAKYIGVQPGPSGAPLVSEFDGIESPLALTASEAEEVVIVNFDNGLGLQVGSQVKHRGIVVGEVMSIDLNEDLSGVDVRVRLVTQARAIARQGSQFWIEVPRFEFTRVRSLETAVTGPYLAVRPGPADGQAQQRFVGLLQPPIESYRDEGALELVLHSQERLGLQAGAPVSYRGLSVGQVVNVGLSSDALQVEARVVIDPEFTDLVRENTRFWSTSGLDLNVGLRGISVSLDTLATVAAGGVAFATPDAPGAQVHTGRRFELETDEVESWKDWEPSLVVGSSLLPRGDSLPQPQVASLQWEARKLGLKRPRQRTGWITPVEGNLWIAPPNLLEPEPGKNDSQTGATLALGGNRIELPLDPVQLICGTGVFELQLEEPIEAERWPLARMRHPVNPEDVAVVSAGQKQLPIDAARITAKSAEHWAIGGSLAATEDWHGANVISRQDGKLIGIVIFDDGHSWICPLSQELLAVVKK